MDNYDARCHVCCKSYTVKDFATNFGNERIPVVKCPHCGRMDYQERLGW